MNSFDWLFPLMSCLWIVVFCLWAFFQMSKNIRRHRHLKYVERKKDEIAILAHKFLTCKQAMGKDSAVVRELEADIVEKWNNLDAFLCLVLLKETNPQFVELFKKEIRFLLYSAGILTNSMSVRSQ